jgi:hypothetical protein
MASLTPARPLNTPGSSGSPELAPETEAAGFTRTLEGIERILYLYHDMIYSRRNSVGELRERGKHSYFGGRHNTPRSRLLIFNRVIARAQLNKLTAR